MSTRSLNPDNLKGWVHKAGITKSEQLLLALATFDSPTQLASVLDALERAGVRRASFPNPSALLGSSKGMAIRLPSGWEITESGRRRLNNLGVSDVGVGVLNVARDIRNHAARIEDLQTRVFLDEAIRGFELGLLRSAVVMAWLAAVHVLQCHVINHALEDFNAEAARVDQRWKPARTVDDLGRMKEGDFLDRLASISVIGKNVKSALRAALDLRNACGHPNSMKLGVNTVAAHIETLILNVFARFG